MTAALETRVGWCPGALRPMPSRDGLIVRVKPRGATLSPAQAIGIAAAASSFGNGALDLTSHANLQIRGASEATLAGLTTALDRLGLLDPDVGAETRRNVMMSPLAGLDPEALLDIRLIVAALEDRLVAETGLAGLPGKFCFAVSDGGRLPLGDAGADVTFDAVRISQLCDGFVVRLGGDDGTVAFCPAPRVPDVAAHLARWFIAARAADPDLRRMRHAVARFGAAAILAAAGLRAEASTHPSPSWPGLSRPPTPVDEARRGQEGWSSYVESGAVLGAAAALAEVGLRAKSSTHPSPSWPGLSRPPTPTDETRSGDTQARDSGVGHFSLEGGVGGRDKPGHDDFGLRKAFRRDETCHVLGVAAAFGRLDAAQLDTLARGAAQAGASELRLTPWRAILVPGLTRSAAERLAADCAATGLITDPDDPRLRVAACAGATGCHRGTTPVLEHAARWAALLEPGPCDRRDPAACLGLRQRLRPPRYSTDDTGGRGRAISRREPRHARPCRARRRRGRALLGAACKDRPT